MPVSRDWNRWLGMAFNLLSRLIARSPLQLRQLIYPLMPWYGLWISYTYSRRTISQPHLALLCRYYVRLTDDTRLITLSLLCEVGREDVIRMFTPTSYPHPLGLQVSKVYQFLKHRLDTRAQALRSLENRAGRGNKPGIPLLYAAELNLPELLKILLACDMIDVTATDEHGNQALHRAAANGHARCVTLLLADGRIDINTRNAQGHSPLDLAEQQGRTIVAAQLHARAKSLATHTIPAVRQDELINANGKLTFLTVLKSGGEFLPEHVERLREQIAQHYTLPHRFYCLSDQPLSCPWVPLECGWQGWWSKLELFRHDFGPAVYFDLDTTILSNLDWLVDAPKHFSMITEFTGRDVMNSGIMAWTGTEYRHLADDFHHQADSRYRDWWWGDAAWIRERVPDKVSLQERFPKKIASYKVSGHRYLQGISVVCFHGVPRPWEVAPPGDVGRV